MVQTNCKQLYNFAAVLICLHRICNFLLRLQRIQTEGFRKTLHLFAQTAATCLHLITVGKKLLQHRIQTRNKREHRRKFGKAHLCWATRKSSQRNIHGIKLSLILTTAHRLATKSCKYCLRNKAGQRRCFVLPCREPPVLCAPPNVNLLTIDVLLGPSRQAEGEVQKVSLLETPEEIPSWSIMKSRLCGHGPTQYNC